MFTLLNTDDRETVYTSRVFHIALYHMYLPLSCEQQCIQTQRSISLIARRILSLLELLSKFVFFASVRKV